MSLNPRSTTEDIPRFTIAVISNASFEATIAVLKQAITAEDLLLIYEIPVQSILAKHGIPISATKQLLFFHPRYIQRILVGAVYFLL